MSYCCPNLTGAHLSKGTIGWRIVLFLRQIDDLPLTHVRSQRSSTPVSTGPIRRLGLLRLYQRAVADRDYLDFPLR
jgi:hypothetical protein